METRILKVVKCGEKYSVKSEKSENGQMDKRNLVLKELGGKYEDVFAVAALGQTAQQELKEDALVAVSLRFQTREYNGQVFQDITANEIVPIS